MTRKDWSYENSSSAAHGRMRCSVCRQPIQGEYRVRDAGNAFVTQHRACCPADPMWARLDRNRAAQAKHYNDLLQAAIAFRDRWGITELDELIESLAA